MPRIPPNRRRIGPLRASRARPWYKKKAYSAGTRRSPDTFGSGADTFGSGLVLRPPRLPCRPPLGPPDGRKGSRRPLLPRRFFQRKKNNEPDNQPIDAGISLCSLEILPCAAERRPRTRKRLDLCARSQRRSETPAPTFRRGLSPTRPRGRSDSPAVPQAPIREKRGGHPRLRQPEFRGRTGVLRGPAARAASARHGVLAEDPAHGRNPRPTGLHGDRNLSSSLSSTDCAGQAAGQIEAGGKRTEPC